MQINWPIIDMLPGLLASHHPSMNGPLMFSVSLAAPSSSTHQGSSPWTTYDPTNINHNVSFLNYLKGQELLEIVDMLGDGIFNAYVDSWKSQRRKAHRLMSCPQFRSFIGKSSHDKVENRLIPLLTDIARQGVAIDLQDVFLRLNLDDLQLSLRIDS